MMMGKLILNRVACLFCVGEGVGVNAQRLPAASVTHIGVCLLSESTDSKTHGVAVAVVMCVCARGGSPAEIRKLQPAVAIQGQAGPEGWWASSSEAAGRLRRAVAVGLFLISGIDPTEQQRWWR
jgi:hypothetical protein